MGAKIYHRCWGPVGKPCLGSAAPSMAADEQPSPPRADWNAGSRPQTNVLCQDLRLNGI